MIVALGPVPAAGFAPVPTVLTGVDAAVARVRAALVAVAAGRPVLVVDDADREDEGDLILAADAATPEAVAFVLRHSSGVLCVALPGERCDALDLPPMVPTGADSMGTAFTVSVDARAGTTTGISAADRATTIRLLADPSARPDDLLRPGHVFPLRARDGGVLRRRGHTEAAVDLARLAGRAPAGLLCEVVSPDHARMADGAELRALAVAHDLPLLSVADLVAYRERHDPAPVEGVRRGATTRMPTRHGVFTAHGYRAADGREHLALAMGDLGSAAVGAPVPVHLHVECLVGDPFGALRCACRQQLDGALAAVAAAGRGVVVYLRPRDAGVLRHPEPDAATTATGAAVLRDLGVRRVELLPGDPTDPAELGRAGVDATAAVEPLSARAG